MGFSRWYIIVVKYRLDLWIWGGIRGYWWEIELGKLCLNYINVLFTLKFFKNKFINVKRGYEFERRLNML